MTSIASGRKTSLFFAAYVALVLPLCFLGYGSDNDTYGILEAGRSTWQDGRWMTSRNPGYWLYEALTYTLAHLGGPLAANIGSLCAGAFILWRVIVLCRRLGGRHEYLIAFCVLMVPVFWIAASSTMDYLWSLAFLVAAAEGLIGARLGLASIAGGMAIGFRASNSLVLAGAYAGLLVYLWRAGGRGSEAARVMLSGLAAVVLGLVFYVPSWELAHHTFGFLTAGIGPAAMWTLKMHVGRFFYKGAYLFGPLATVVLLILAVRGTRGSDGGMKSGGRALAVFAGAWLGNVALFAKYPIEVSYLLPGMIFFLLLAGITFLRGPRWKVLAVLGAIAVFNFVSVSFAKPNTPLHATDAKLTFLLRSGVLLEDIRIRRKVERCDSVACWAKYAQEQPEI